MPRATLEQLVEGLREAHGDDLQAVVLYGSAAAGEHVPKRSDLNVLVLVRRLDLSRLEREAATAKRWSDAGNPPPLTMTLDEWRRCADIFPMEYLDILQRHRVLYGTPPFDGVEVEPSHLRLQAEQEAMGKLIKLRQGVLAAGNDPRAQAELLAASLSTFMVIARAVVRLHGRTPPTDYDELSRLAAEMAQFDPEPFVRVAGHVRGNGRLAKGEIRTVLAGYLSGAQRLFLHIDEMDASGRM